MIFQSVCQRIEHEAHQPADDKRDKNGRQIFEKQETDQDRCQQYGNIVDRFFIFFING
jgi:hypothetical protein